MNLKDITLYKGMNIDDVNDLVSYFIKLNDDLYLGSKYKHNWTCKECGKVFIRNWDNMYTTNIFNCGCVKRKDQEDRYKYEVEKTGEYEYIRSFRKGETLPNGKILKSTPYLQVKHKYCGSVYTVNASGFINDGKKCSKCCHKYENSFAHHIEVELGESLEKYWDFEKNTVNPNTIWKSGREQIWIKCQEKDYHGSYEVICRDFTKGYKCPYCNTFASGKVHLYDSFGYHNFDKVMSWHIDNKVSPFKLSLGTSKKIKFICETCGHEWITSLVTVSHGSWCPVCSSSKGEKKIISWMNMNNIACIYDKKYFDDLVGTGGGLLRPDFILPEHKIWIEYDGKQHYEWVKGMMDQDMFLRLKEHDKRKDKYAKKHGWKMIRIPYWDFDNIEEILNDVI